MYTYMQHNLNNNAGVIAQTLDEAREQVSRACREQLNSPCTGAWLTHPVL